MLEIKVDKIRSYQTLVFKNGYRSFRTKEYKDYINEITSQLGPLKQFLDGDLKITIHFKNKNRVIGDLDNITKPILDILQMNGNIKNDKQVVELDLKKSFGYDENIIEIEVKII